MNERRWRVAKTKPCDGEGCCSTFGLFNESGFFGPCRYWDPDELEIDKRCKLMKEPRLLEGLYPHERRMFQEKCVDWPVPARLDDLNETYTQREKDLLKLRFGKDCCYSWRECWR
jgi:hypothetical protein